MKLGDAKIAWVVQSIGMKGDLLYHKPLLECLAARCRSFRVFTSEFQGDQNLLEFKIEQCGGIRRLYSYEKVANLGAQGNWDEASLMTPSVVGPLIKYRPDLIVLDEFSLWSLYMVLVRPLIPGVRFLLLVETRPRFTETGWLRLARKVLRTFIAKRTDMILTNNEDGRNYLISYLKASTRKIIVSPYLVSDMPFTSGICKKELWEYRASRRVKYPVRFLFVGRLVQLKGLQYALESLAALLPEYRGRFVFEVVGDGSFRPCLERQVQEMGLSQHVWFRGRQPYSTLWEWYKRADVFLFPTLLDYRALVSFEALSMGLPIVASVHDGGVYETVDVGRNGFSFDPQDTVSLTKILAQFLDSPEIIEKFGKRSLEMASAYTLEPGVESLARACQRALDSKLE